MKSFKEFVTDENSTLIVGKDNIPQSGWKNLPETGDLSCKCGSWLSHWKNITDTIETTVICKVHGCYKKATDGAHVQNKDVSGWWIIPLCHKHNEQKEELTLRKGAKLASANKEKTCEK